MLTEGVDVPSVDTILLLRPTESATVFLQQLGRGLRLHPGKDVCTVLDFIGQHRREFRMDRRLRALFGGSRKHLIEQVEGGFPFLPAGCQMQLDAVSSEIVMRTIKNAIPTLFRDKAAGVDAANPEGLRAIGEMVGRFLDHKLGLEYVGRLFGPDDEPIDGQP